MTSSTFFVMGWLNYSDSELGFSIKYPDNWVQESNSNIVVFLSPKKNVMDLFQENVNVISQDLSKQPMTMEQYTELTKRQVVDNFGESAIISLGDVRITRELAKEFVYNMNYQGMKLRVKQYWIIKNKMVYLFTYTAESEQYDLYENVAMEMIESFRCL
jgi:hypothetical protein